MNAPKPTTAKEQANTRVKQGTENAPAPDTVGVRTAEGKDVQVNPEAQNTTQTLESRRAIDENPATRALREQTERAELQGLVQNTGLVTAAEQASQQQYLIDKGLADDPDHPDAKKRDEHKQR